MKWADLGRPAGNRAQRALGRAVDAVGSTHLADVVDRLGLVPREVELREHPDTPALGVNIGTTATVDEAIAMGRRFLEESAAHGLHREGIWVWHTRPSGALTRIYVEPEWGAPQWTADQVNSADFATSPSEAAAAVVGRPWDAWTTENPRTKEGTMQDDKAAERIDAERSAERANPDGAGRTELPVWLRVASDTPRDPAEWICGNPDCGHQRRSHRSNGAGVCGMVDCTCEDFQLHRGGVVQPEQEPMTVTGPTRAKVHIQGDGTSRNTTVAIVLEDGTEIPISNVTRVKVEQGLGGPGHAEVETVMVENPIDVVLDADIGPKPISELRVVVDDDTPASLMHSGPKFVGLQDQDGKPVECFSWFSEETGKRQLRIPIRPWPSAGEPRAMVNSHVETARRMLDEVRLTLEETPRSGPLGEALGAVVEAILELEKAPIVPGGIYAELRHAIARGDAAQASARDFADALRIKVEECTALRGAIANAMPLIRQYVEGVIPMRLSNEEAGWIAELERAAVGASAEPGPAQKALDQVASLEEECRAHIEQIEALEAQRAVQGERERAYARASRMLINHLAGRDPAWWIEAAEAMGELRSLVMPAMRAGDSDNSAEKAP